MNVSTITEEGADLIYRGLKLVEADIIKFRTGAEGRGYKHTVDECNAQLQALRGNGAEPGLFSQFDAFEAGALSGDGSESEDQLALVGGADETAGTVSADDVPVNRELEQGTQIEAVATMPILHRPGGKDDFGNGGTPVRRLHGRSGAKGDPLPAKKRAGRPKGSKTSSTKRK